jgi:hypothetical protein
MSKSAEDGAGGGFAGEMVLKELKEKLAEYLCFVSSDWVICDVCNQRVKVWNFPSHVENEHYDPPTRVWSKGPKAGWRRKLRQLEKRVL